MSATTRATDGFLADSKTFSRLCAHFHVKLNEKILFV